MLEAGLNPEVAVATCGLFNDPMDVVAQSREYLRKWDYKEPQEADPPVPASPETDPETDPELG